MATIVIHDAERRLGMLGNILFPILKELKVRDGQMIEFSFVVSLEGSNVALHKSYCAPVPKTKQTTKH